MTIGQFDLTLGPYSVGTNLNFFLFGLVAYQYAHYWDSNYRDNLLIRCLVSWLLCVDLLHTVLEGYMLWLYTITHFAEPEFLGVVNWVFCMSPMLVAFSSIPVQVFLSYRVYLLSKNKVLFAFTTTCAITQGLAAIGTSVGCFILSDISKLQNLTPIVCLWFPVQIICDLTLTSSLIWTLRRSKTGYSSTDNVVKRLIRASVETAFFALLFVILDMSLFFGFPTTNLHIIFAFTTGRIYSNALLGTLNARTAHREALHGGARSQPNVYHMSPPTTTLGNGDIKSHVQSHPIAISVSHVVESGRGDEDDSLNGRTYSADRKV